MTRAEIINNKFCECTYWARTDLKPNDLMLPLSEYHHPDCPKKPIKVFRVTPGKDLNPFSEVEIKDVILWLEEAQPGDTITIEVLEMSKQEYDNLPEYMGP